MTTPQFFFHSFMNFAVDLTLVPFAFVDMSQYPVQVKSGHEKHSWHRIRSDRVRSENNILSLGCIRSGHKRYIDSKVHIRKVVILLTSRKNSLRSVKNYPLSRIGSGHQKNDSCQTLVCGFIPLRCWWCKLGTSYFCFTVVNFYLDLYLYLVYFFQYCYRSCC